MCAPLEPAPGISIPSFTQSPHGWLMFGVLALMWAAFYSLLLWRFEQLRRNRLTWTLLALSFACACGVLLVAFVIWRSWEAPLAAWWRQQTTLVKNPAQLSACYNAADKALADAGSATEATTAALGLALGGVFMLSLVAVKHIVKRGIDPRVANVLGQDSV
jgi:hypothetical protein